VLEFKNLEPASRVEPFGVAQVTPAVLPRAKLIRSEREHGKNAKRTSATAEEETKMTTGQRATRAIET